MRYQKQKLAEAFPSLRCENESVCESNVSVAEAWHTLLHYSFTIVGCGRWEDGCGTHCWQTQLIQLELLWSFFQKG